MKKWRDRLLCGGYNWRDKSAVSNAHIGYMLARTQSMFKYTGLPDTVPARMLELYLQTNGNVCWYRHNGELYVFTGGLGGKPDAYYMPTVYTIANPALNISANLDIGRECIVMPNDSLYMGLIPMYNRYATAMTETEISLTIASINSRLISLISAQDDATKASAERVIAQIEDGKLGIVGEQAFLDGLKVQPYANGGCYNNITNLIELEQYYKASWYNELGLNANYNMKRESINAGESQLNNDALLPLVDDMLNCRKTGLEKVNAMFGTQISVSLASSWDDNQLEIDAEQRDLSERSEKGGDDGGDSDETE